MGMPWIVIVPDGIKVDSVDTTLLLQVLKGSHGVLLVPAELGTEMRRMVMTPTAPQPEPLPKPCTDGFKWIGQPANSCDECGQPAWDHTGMAVSPPGVSPFGKEPWLVRPWRPGEADRLWRHWAMTTGADGDQHQ